MGKTNTERSRIFRKKLKEDLEKYNVYKSNDKRRKKHERSKKKDVAPSEVNRLRRLNRERVKKYRMKKKDLGVKHDLEDVRAYSTPQALGKAVGKVKSRLPKSPRKRKAVIKKLASSTGLHISKRRKADLEGNRRVSEATISKVQAFYVQDSVSRQAPGRRDFVTTWQNGKKEHLQKRHMMFSLKETHALFLEENPDVKVGLSKFSSLRPENVLLSSDMPINVCLCSYHENIRLICDCLNKEISNFPNYSGDFVDNLVCDSGSEECMLGRCSNCPKWLDTIRKESEGFLDDPLLWYQWERVEVAYQVKKKNLEPKNIVKKMKKICKEGTLDDVLSSLESKIPSFLEHVFIKRQQSKYFEEKLTHLDQEEAVVQVDFAENYTCKHQDEVQSAHWNQEQVTLFTVAIWTKCPSGDNVCETHVIISDEMAHDKTSVAVFMSTILSEFVKEKHPDVKKAYIFSDGPSSQFKNKYIVSILHKLNQIVNIQWNYFATSHGKGVVDGVGGTIKRLVWKALAARKAAVVVDAKSFYNVAKQLQSSVTVSLVDREQIGKKFIELCLKACFSEAAALPGISKFHCIEPQGNGFVHCRQYSNQNFVESQITPSVFPFDSDDTDSESCEVESCSDNQSCREEAESYLEEESDDSNNDGDDSDLIVGHGNKNRGDEEDEEEDDFPFKVQQGIPKQLLHLFQNSTSFALPHYVVAQVDSIMSGLISFSGGSLIDMKDLHSLYGNSQNQEDNWLSNFVIDKYMVLIQSCTTSEMNVKVLTLSWEIFEKGKPNALAKSLKKEYPFDQDLILIPCNEVHSKHWFLLAVLPKEKLAMVLDSRAGDYVKPPTNRALSKIAMILKEVDPDCNLQEWTFACNKQDDIPQQSNQKDCGVFTCLYARCLAGLGPMVHVDVASILEFRKSIIFSEHRGELQTIPVPDIMLEQYYAVDYVTNYYIGRAISIANQVVKFKFLHRLGADKFDWPKRDDVDDVHVSCIFFGPVSLENSGPFIAPLQQEIEKLFSATR